ncbi:MAG: hypothetical protein HYZ37_06995 [Candidatus Solibacter usitatus]|nr:hypothetical protein [Candidatus Solibacter usitatus]
MAKFKPAGKKKGGSGATGPGAVPCVILIVGGIILVTLLFYAILGSARK